MRHLTVSFNFNALHQSFSTRTAQILERAAFLCTAADQTTENPGLLPNVEGPVIPVKLQPRPVDDVRAEGERWIMGCALRDCLEQVQGFLEQVRRMCAALSLATEGPVPAERFGEVVFEPARRFDRLGFPDKVDLLRTDFGEDILDERIEHILTLNAARNCLVHRGGVVGDRDCDEDGQLVVRWNTFELAARAPDGEEGPVVVGDVVPGGSQLLLKHDVVERLFPRGDRVTFTPTDLSGVWVTLHFFGVRTALRVVEFAKARGFTSTEEPEIAEGSGES